MAWGILRQRLLAARPLLRPGMRRPAALLAAGCVVVTAGLAMAFGHQARPGRLDAAVDTGIRRFLDSYPGPLHLLARLGGLLPVAELTAALVLACLVTRRWRGAVLAALAVPTAVTLTEFVLKPAVGRRILGYASFPSGHATAMFALAAICAVLLANPPRPRLPRTVRLLLAAGAVLVAVAVPVAMVALGFHYFTDIVAGAAVGIGTVLLTALLIDLARPADRAPRGPAAEDTATVSASRLP
jgi:membrane-associated phospholipid phosphatase